MRNKKVFELENEGQGQGWQNIRNGTIRWQMSTAITSYSIIFRRFRNMHISKFVTWTMYVAVTMYYILGGPNRWQIPDFLSDFLSAAPIDGRYQTSYPTSYQRPQSIADTRRPIPRQQYVCIFERLLVKIATWKVWPWKVRSSSRSTTFEMVPFDGKYQPLQQSYLGMFRWLSPFTSYSHFKIRYLENIGQGHDVQHSQWRHSTANTCLAIWWQ